MFPAHPPSQPRQAAECPNPHPPVLPRHPLPFRGRRLQSGRAPAQRASVDPPLSTTTQGRPRRGEGDAAGHAVTVGLRRTGVCCSLAALQHGWPGRHLMSGRLRRRLRQSPGRAGSTAAAHALTAGARRSRLPQRRAWILPGPRQWAERATHLAIAASQRAAGDAQMATHR
eukprot:scaffold5870_cov93-Isochrysis_galbana.AAC.2